MAQTEEKRKSPKKAAKGETIRTLFVRNLPYSTSDAQLSSVFEKYGGIKSCFTVKDKGVIDRCKGFGYVLFEKREDAEKARGGVKKVNGRPVQIVFADKRALKQDRKPRMSKGEGEGEKELTRDVELADGAMDDYNDESESEDDSESDYEALTAGDRGATVPTAKHNKPRTERGEARYDIGRVVVVTGIPDDTRKSKLRKKCSKYGPLEEFLYPAATTEEETEAAEDKGVNGKIAHVTYKSYTVARKAMRGLEGLKLDGAVNPLAAVLMSREGKTVSKLTLAKSRVIVRNLSFDCHSKDLQKVFSQYGKVQEVHIPRKPNGYMRGYAFVQFTSYFDAAKALEGVNGTELRGRLVAVDWVAPKSHYEASLQKTAETKDEKRDDVQEQLEESEDDSEGEMSGEEEGEGEGEGERERDASGSKSDDSDDEGGDGSEFDRESDSEEEEGEGRGGAEKKPFKVDVHEGKTVFVRNLPLVVNEEELKELFSQFGRVRYARVVLNKITGLSRGSAFVQYLNPASLQRCLEGSRSDNAVVYSGRQLDVSLALSPRELEDMAERGREKTDKRNLYLAKEGTVLPDSEAAEGVSKTDMAKRIKAHAEKKSKLANPNFYVSKTRLSVRNLPTQVCEQRLKEIFSSVTDSGKITQLKILRSKDRLDGQGIGRSKGFAFAEFSTHDSALTALRAINNNPQILGPNKRPIVEFAIEDVRVIRAHEQRKKRVEAKAAREQGDSKPVEGEEKKRPNEKVEWQIKCKEKRMRRRENQAEKKKESEGAPSPGKDGVFVVTEKRVPAAGASKRKRKTTAPGIQTETADDGKLVGRGSVKKKNKKNGLAPVSQHEAESVNSALIGRKRKAARDDSDIARADDGEGEGSVRHRPRAAKQQKTGSGVKRSDSELLEGQGVKPAGKQSRKRRRGGAEEREERAFVDMVASYRRKLITSQ